MPHEPAPQEPTRIDPRPVDVGMSVSGLIETAFLGSTAGQLAEAAGVLTGQVLLHADTLVGLSVDASLAPGGTAASALVPLLEGGCVDWLAVTGANLYYDALLSLRTPMLRASLAPGEGYEDCGGSVFVDSKDRVGADATLKEILAGPEFQRPMSSASMHQAMGRKLREREKDLGCEFPNLLSSAQELGVPIFNPSPSESPLGSLVADLAQVGNRLSIDPSKDLNHAASILNAVGGGDDGSAVWCLGRGAASNFLLGAPAHLQRILGPEARGSYGVRLRMAGRAHELPSATVGSAPARNRDMKISTDLSVAIPLLAAYILDRAAPRPLKRLGDRLEDLLDKLREDHLQATLKRPI
ncbi:deoxyhypusine synthase family protein [Candidatus Eisenbacteria bacterium]|uniref:Deoxyhypusine synthase family protein n=1 Tax=Eiseniibacteriota bacterium TaxID=2212470 RepID=A0ABV6YJX2_UNCEI